MPTQVLTFRAQLHDSISNVLATAEMVCEQTASAVVALVVALADYREEGRELYPRILIADDLPQALKIVQGSSFLVMGSGDRTDSTASRALKRCAPLAAGGWAIGINRLEGSFEYGVFREPLVPTAVDLRSTVLDLNVGDAKVLLVSQVAPNTVEIISSGQHPLEIHLSADAHDVQPTQETLDVLPGWLVEDIDGEQLQAAARSFWSTLLTESLRMAHGALIAVASADSEIPEQLAADCVRVTGSPLLVELLSDHELAKSADSLSALLAFRSLFSGMLASDGITVVDTRGDLLAFNCFLPIDADKQPTGGARSRAFNTLSHLVDEGGLRGAFIRSTDGQSRTYESGGGNAG